MGFSVGLHTNGMFPRVIEGLLDRHLVDMIALDIKTRGSATTTSWAWLLSMR